MTDSEQYSDGQIYIATPSGGRSGPGVIVIHAFWGLTDIFKGVCDRLAQDGFVAAAPDLYDGKVTSEIEEAFGLVDALWQKNKEAQEKVRHAIRVLQAHPQVQGRGLGVMGFSMGASYALLLSNAEPEVIKAVVLYYGTAGDMEMKYEAAYLGHFAENDPYESADDMRALEAAIRASGREVNFTTYPNTSHWFIEENRPEYDPAAAQAAWESTLAFLHRHLDTASETAG